ncbi:FIST signal transduction protein [Sphingomonas echinoides]|uniref:FIST signal transduction protein n=1 Tax=Sphingomonas echinoides TaxID=59803 RepID=UPI00241344C0|nr:FIST N-terminal domain-containing protein [Sphingomonas echinoides]
MWSKRINGGNPTETFPASPDLVIVFAPTGRFADTGFRDDLVHRYHDAFLIGCSSGTMVEDNRLDDDAVVILGMGFAKTRLKLAVQPLPSPDCSFATGVALAQELADETLSGIFVLSSGLNVNGSALVAGLRSGVGDGVALSGGLAGDGPRFADTRVLARGECLSNGVAAVGFYGEHVRFAHGSAGEWQPFGPVRTISDANESEVGGLDHEPALALYERYLGEEAENLPASGLLYPLEIWDPVRPDDRVVRTLLAIDRDKGTLTFAGDMPQGWKARLMRGIFDDLVGGASTAAQHAADHAGTWGVAPSACLAISCVGRRLLMGQRTEEEIMAVSAVVGSDIALAGFYSYGEIAPQNVTGVPCLHNQTMTITLIGECE